MAHLTCWEFTELPVEIIDVVERDIKKFDDEVEDSIKSLRKNFKAGNYFAISTFFIIFGISSVLTQVFNGNYFIQAMVYFSMSFLCILAFSFIIWRLLK